MDPKNRPYLTLESLANAQNSLPKDHSHYYKNVQHLKLIDVYRVLDLYNVTNPCLQHAIKKLLVAGGRGAGKNVKQDLCEAADSIYRALEMMEEDAGKR